MGVSAGKAYRVVSKIRQIPCRVAQSQFAQLFRAAPPVFIDEFC